MENENMKTMGDSVTSRSIKDLEDIVVGRLNGRVRAFQLILESQGLILRGRTRTFYAKQLAQHLVKETSKVQILANDIEVLNGNEA